MVSRHVTMNRFLFLQTQQMFDVADKTMMGREHNVYVYIMYDDSMTTGHEYIQTTC